MVDRRAILLDAVGSTLICTLIAILAILAA